MRHALSTAVGLLAACVAGCGDADPQGRIELWTLALQPQFTDYMESRIEVFEAEHPGTDVVWVDVPFDAIDRKLVAAAAAGRAPDVINLSDRQFARFASLGALADIEPILPGDAREQYLGGALGMCRVGDGLSAVPWYLTTQTMMANRGVLAVGDLDPGMLEGRSWDEIRALGSAFHEASGEFLFSLPLGQESVLVWMMLAEGLEVFGEDEDGNLEPRLDAPEIASWLGGWVEYYRSGAMPREAATVGHSHLIELYQNGRLGFIVTGPNFLKRVRDTAASVFDATAVLPPPTGALGRQHIAVMVLGVTAQADDPELAAALAWSLTSPTAQAEFCKLVTILPSTIETLQDPYFSPDLAAIEDPAERLIAQARGDAARALTDAVAFTPALEAWPDLRRAFEDRIKGVLLDPGADLSEALGEINTAWASILSDLGGGSLEAVPQPEPIGRSASR